MSHAIQSPASLSGRLLADVVDECWLAAASDRVLGDATLSRWRTIHVRAASIGRHGSNIPAPPSDAVLQAMIGAAWWEEFDSLSLTVRPVPASADPLHYYAGTVVEGRARDRLLGAIEKARPSVFAVAVQPLVVAIAGGSLPVQAFAGVQPVTLPAALLRGRNWSLARRGDLKITAPGETCTTFAQPTLGLPIEAPSGARPVSGNLTGFGRSDRGGRPVSYDWVAFSHQLFRLALSPDGIGYRAYAVRKMADWCAERWEEPPDQRTIERKVRELLPPEMPARKP